MTEETYLDTTATIENDLTAVKGLKVFELYVHGIGVTIDKDWHQHADRSCLNEIEDLSKKVTSSLENIAEFMN